jgi:hypothetical protein
LPNKAGARRPGMPEGDASNDDPSTQAIRAAFVARQMAMFRLI